MGDFPDYEFKPPPPLTPSELEKILQLGKSGMSAQPLRGALRVGMVTTSQPKARDGNDVTA